MPDRNITVTASRGQHNKEKLKNGLLGRKIVIRAGSLTRDF